MEITEENIAWAIGKLEILAGFQGFPESSEAIRARAKSFLKLVRNETVTHKKLGQVNDADWILETCLETFERCPAPVQMRLLYCRYFTPARELEIEE